MTDHGHGAAGHGAAGHGAAGHGAAGHGAAGHGAAGHGAMEHGHGGHGDHAAQFRDRFWWSLLLAAPVVAFSSMFADLLGYSLPAGHRLDLPGPRHGRLPVRRVAVPDRRGRRDPGPAARDDAAGRAGDHRRVRRQRRHLARSGRARPGLLVGAGAPGRDHAARPLAGDARPRPGLSPRSTRWPRCCRTRPTGSDRTARSSRCRCPSCAPATWSWSARAAGCRRTGSSTDGEAEVDESMITGESPAGAQAAG